MVTFAFQFKHEVMIHTQSFGAINGQPVTAFTLSNAQGVSAVILDYGAILSSVIVPDCDGVLGDVVLGYEDINGFLPHPNYPYMGAIIGRYGNRIRDAQFTLDGQTYTLASNLGNHHLHGGNKGFDQAIWEASIPEATTNRLVLKHHSPDGNEGYPGHLEVTVTYTLDENNALHIDYEATTDKATPVNLTNHAYFNLSAGTSPDILAHELWLCATQCTEVDEGNVPTGNLVNIEGTALDFNVAKPIGRDIGAVSGGGYDHNYVLVQDCGVAPVLMARVLDPSSGRSMEMYTTEPAVQLYSGIFLNEPTAGKHGAKYGQYAGFCLEAQHYPDSPNQPKFPDTILRPGAVYRQKTVYVFRAY